MVCTAQATFQKTYGLRTNNSYNSDGCSSAQQTSDGGYIFAGSSQSPYDYSADAYVVKTDSLGSVLWSKTYGGLSSEAFYSVKQTSDSGYILAGYTASFGAGVGIYLVKTDVNGDTLWTTKIVKVGYLLTGYSVEQTYDTGYIITGEIQDRTGETHDDVAFLLKTNLNGKIIWIKTYGKGFSNSFSSVKQTQDSGYIIAGYSSGGTFLVKTNVNGDTVWTKTYAGPPGATSVVQTSDGGYALTGTGGTDYADIFLLKTDTNGNLLWEKEYGRQINGSGTSISDVGKSMEQTGDGGFIIAGVSGNGTVSPPTGSLYVIKTNGNGDILWTKIYGDNNSETNGFSIHQTKDKGYIIAGSSYSYFSGQQDVLLIKTDSNGVSGCNEYSPQTTVSSPVFVSYSGAEVTTISALLKNTSTLDNSPSTEITTLCTTLPIVWGGFTAEKTNKEVLLKWSTLQEQNTSQYVIERGADGVHFTSVGSATAAHNSSTIKNYRFTDEKPLQGENFYRLKQIDIDGKYIYSEVRSVNFNKLNNTTSISPNPAKNLLRLSTSEGLGATTATINIYSSAMQLVQTIKVTQGDRNTINIPVERLASGIYFLQLVNAGEVSTVKFVKE